MINIRDKEVLMEIFQSLFSGSSNSDSEVSLESVQQRFKSEHLQSCNSLRIRPSCLFSTRFRSQHRQFNSKANTRLRYYYCQLRSRTRWDRGKLCVLPLWKHHRKFTHPTSRQPWISLVCDHEGLETQSHLDAVWIIFHPLRSVQSRSMGWPFIQRCHYQRGFRSRSGWQANLDGVRWLSCAGGHQRLSSVDCCIGKDNLPSFCPISLSKVRRKIGLLIKISSILGISRSVFIATSWSLIVS